MPGPTLIMLHSLGASAREWDWVVAALGDDAECRPLDLPGFGGRADMGALGVGGTVDWLADQVRARAPERWMLVGHSMGGKMATLLAARAAGGEAGLGGLAGVALLAASPPAPEPMDEDVRRRLIDSVANGPPSEADARRIVEGAVAAPPPPDRMARAVADLRRCSPAAYAGWMERGSREDWSDRAGRVDLPALIVAGERDGALGEANQRRLNLPHYPQASVEIVRDAAHLLPLERPESVAGLLSAFLKHVRD